MLAIRLGKIAVLPAKAVSPPRDRNKMADDREWLVFHAVRIVFRWFRDVVRSYLIKRKAIIDSSTVLPDRRL